MPSKPYTSTWLHSYLRYGLALVASLLLHLLLLGGIEWEWPLASHQDAVINVELALPPPSSRPVAGKAAAPATAPRKHTPRKQVNTPSTSSRETPSAASAEPATSTSTEQALTQPDAQAPVVDQPVPTADQPALTADQTIPDNSADASNPMYESDIAASAPPLDVPTSVAMDYAVTMGEGSGTIAITHVSYEKAADDSYTLRSETEAKGLASLFLSGRLIQTSRGHVNKQGLQPMYYSYEFGKKADKRQQAEFDWQASQLTMHTSKGDSTVALPPATQDLLSFMYQYMFVAPLDQMALSVTNGKKLSHYVYTFEGEEAVRTKLGDLRALHIAKSTADSDEKTELWLAIDYHYLPIKIRKTEKDGKLYEQTVTRLSTK